MADDVIPAAESAPIAAEQPIVDAAPAVEAAPPPAEQPVESAPAEPAPSTLEAAPNGVEPAAKPPAEAAPEAPIEAATPEPVTYAEFKMPEGMSAAPEQIKAFTDLLGTVDPRTQDGAQALMDLHTAALQAYDANALQRQQEAFDSMRAGWVKDFDKRAGNRRDTVLNDAKWAIESSITDSKELKAFWNAFALTGAGDHPDVVFGLARLAGRLRERKAPAVPTPQKGISASPVERRYGAPARR